jgi:putative transcriptional regulator
MQRPNVTARQVRERFGLSQADFALRFGLETRTVQNWEQSRYHLDTATMVLLAIIERAPEIVEQALTIGSCPPSASLQREPYGQQR